MPPPTMAWVKVIVLDAPSDDEDGELFRRALMGVTHNIPREIRVRNVHRSFRQDGYVLWAEWAGYNNAELYQQHELFTSAD